MPPVTFDQDLQGNERPYIVKNGYIGRTTTTKVANRSAIVSFSTQSGVVIPGCNIWV